MRTTWIRRSKLVAVCGVLCLGLAGIAIPVGQASAAKTASSPFKYRSEDCGNGTSSYGVIGSVTFSRSDTTLSISITLEGAIPNSHFYMELWGGDASIFTCYDLNTLGTVHVNSTGSATASFQVAITKDETTFFLAAPTVTYPDWSETNNVYLPFTTLTTVVSPFKYRSDSCGTGTTYYGVIGSVEFSRSGTTLTISITLSYGPADTTFDMELWGHGVADVCTELKSLGPVHTNSTGEATATFEVTVAAEETTFFLAAPTTTSPGWSETYDVYLPHIGPSTTCIPATQACHSARSRAGKSTSVSSDKVTVTATGRGTFAVGTYRKDPAGVLSSSAGKFFGISVSNGNKVTTLDVKDCNLGGGTSLDWWNGHAWGPIANQEGTTLTACITFTLGKTNTPSLATLTKLSRVSRQGAVVFAVVGNPDST